METFTTLHARRELIGLSIDALTLIIHGGFAVDCRGGTATLWILILGSGYDKSPADGPGPGFHVSRGGPSLIAGTAWCWSGGLRQGPDTSPGSHDVLGPGPVPRDLHGTATRPPSSSTPSGDPGDLVRRDLRVIHFAPCAPGCPESSCPAHTRR